AGDERGFKHGRLSRVLSLRTKWQRGGRPATKKGAPLRERPSLSAIEALRLAAANLAAGDLAAEQRAGGSAEDGACRPLAARVDRAARQRAGGCANDEAGRAVRALAVIAAVVTPPVTDAVTGGVVTLGVVRALAVRRRPPRRVGRGRERGKREAGG